MAKHKKKRVRRTELALRLANLFGANLPWNASTKKVWIELETRVTSGADTLEKIKELVEGTEENFEDLYVRVLALVFNKEVSDRLLAEAIHKRRRGY